jgi:VIT1/CCC1 family predicted Fe2+/Mn2+ transporter
VEQAERPRVGARARGRDRHRDGRRDDHRDEPRPKADLPASVDHHVAEMHRSQRIGWLRAAVLGANDGIVSVASLLIGVAAATRSHTALVTAGIAGLVAGAMSMATGEFVSVSSQRDAERADRRAEADALAANPMAELRELAKIYEHRGVEPGLARLVAEQLMAHDELGAHMRDEIGITDVSAPNPIQAAWTSALAFSVGAVLPVLVAISVPRSARVGATAAVALGALVVLGWIGARAGGAPPLRASVRVVFWSTIAMTVTGFVGYLAGR